MATFICQDRLHHRWSGVRRGIRSDVQRYLTESVPFGRRPGRLAGVSALATPAVLAIALWRVAHALHVRGWRRGARAVALVNLLVHRVSLAPAACLGDGVYIPHPTGVVFEGRTGRRPTLLSLSACLRSHRGAGVGAPSCGDDLSLGAHAVLLGDIEVGDAVRVGPGALVLKRVPPQKNVVYPLARPR